MQISVNSPQLIVKTLCLSIREVVVVCGCGGLLELLLGYRDKLSICAVASCIIRRRRNSVSLSEQPPHAGKHTFVLRPQFDRIFVEIL